MHICATGRSRNDPAPTRAERFAFAGGGIAADFSKNRITDETLKLLVQLAREAGVEKRRDAMFAGEVVNPTEGRAALHTALRASNPNAPFHQQVQAERAKMAAFADQVRSGAWTGYTGKHIRHVVNIGIGGSDLGPKMVVHALHHLATPEITTHFVSNVDGADLYNVMQQIDPEETLAIIVSKTFTTLETMTNARSLRDWFTEKGCPENALAKHFVGVSANPSEVVKFGIAKENVFEMWDWVGGRYSLWSAVGLSIMIAVGPQQFGELLAGAQRNGRALPHCAARKESAGAAGHDRHLESQLLRLAKLSRRAVLGGAALPAVVSATAGNGEQRQVGASGRRNGRLSDLRGERGASRARTVSMRFSRCCIKVRPSSRSTSLRC